jgi:Synaptobrevin
VHSKIEVVKTNMQGNIQQMLKNNELVADIDVKAEHLTEQSVAFNKGTRTTQDFSLSLFPPRFSTLIDLKNHQEQKNSRISISGKCGRCVYS